MFKSFKLFCKLNIKARRLLFLGIIIISLPMLSGCILLPAKQAAVSNAPELIVPAAISYDSAIETAKRGSLIIDFVDTAYLRPTNFCDASFKQSGLKLEKVYVKEGDTVTQGQLIASADSTNVSNQIKQQENTLARYQLTLAQLKTTGADAISIQKAQLDIDSINLQLDKSKEDLAKTQLYSPVDGKVVYVIGTKDAKMKAGESIVANKTIVRIADHSVLEAEFYINPKQEDDNKFISYIQTGMKVEIEANSKKYEGEITFTPKDLKYIIDKNDTRISLVRMKINNMPAELSSGTPVKFTYTYERKDDVIILPKHIINNYGSLYYVVTIEDNKPVEKYIVLGMQSNTQVEVKSGLKEGDRVISKRYQ